jgi:hypothetical protein
MKFTSEGGLRSHTSYHAEENLKHKCRECGKVFGWDHELSVSKTVLFFVMFVNKS